MANNITEKDLEQLERIAISQECRIEVLRFAREMELILKKNDYKGGWRKCNNEYLNARLVGETGEYFNFVADGDYGSETKKELIDVANICMMLWDNN